MPILQNTGFHILAPEPIDKRMQTQVFAGLDAIPIKYDHMVCHVISEDVDYRYYADVPEWRPIEYGSVVNWGDILGDVTDQTDLINYLSITYAPIDHTHPSGPHRHWPADIYDVDGIVTWVREHEALNYILVGSTDSTGVFQGTMNNFIVTDGAESSIIEDGDTLTFNPKFTLNPLTNTIEYTEDDPTVPSWVKAITTNDISEWNAAYAHSISDHGYEWYLGVPSVDGYILSSTIAGVRTWVENTGGGGGTWQPNTQAQEGYVLAGGANNNRAWMTDGAGNPAWRDITPINAGSVAQYDVTTPALIWYFNHNLGVLNPIIQVWSTNLVDGAVMVPEQIIAKDINNSEIHFSTPATGRVMGVLGGLAPTAITELSDLSDVNTSTPTNRNFLVADGVDWGSRPIQEADLPDSYVPYIGATGNVDLGVHDILATSLKLVGGQDITWNPTKHTIDIPTGFGPTMQVGQEIWVHVHNATGNTILDGKVVYPIGTDTGGLPNIDYAISNSHITISNQVGITTGQILDGEDGFVTLIGTVNGIDTSLLSVGPAYISTTVAGDLTSIRPEFPNYPMLMGVVLSSHATTGSIITDIQASVGDTFHNFWNGVTRESFDFLVTSNGTTVTGALSPSNGQPDLTLLFSDGFYLLNTTPDVTVTLTPGTDTVPVQNYIYILQSTKALIVNTSSFPVEEHIKIATVILRSATSTQTNGARKNHNYNDHIQSDSGQGHLSHITERMRRMPASWESGTEASVTGLPTNAYLQVTGGVVFQMHFQAVNAFSNPVDSASVINHFTTPNLDITDLLTITEDANGDSLNNTSFSAVVWGIANKTGEEDHLIVNLPIGTYSKNTPELAVADSLGYSVYTIPKEYTGTGFLIARFTFINNGGAWTLHDTQDLRGFLPNTSAGGVSGGGAGITSYLGLSDTQNTFVGDSLKLLRVNALETAVEAANITLPSTKVAVATQFLNSFDAPSGVFTSAQPIITDVVGLSAALSDVAYTNVDNNFSVIQTLQSGIKIGSETDAPTLDGDWTGGYSRYFFSAQGNSNLSAIFSPSGSGTTSIFQMNNIDDLSNRGRLLFSINGVQAGISTDKIGTGSAPTDLRLGETGLTGVSTDTGFLTEIGFYFDKVRKAYIDSSGNIIGNNLSGTNSGDNAVNTLYNGLVSNATHTGEVTGDVALTIASGVVDTDNLASDLTDEVPLGVNTDINWNLGIKFTKVLAANWTMTFSNPIVSKTIMIVTTGNFTITFPTGVDVTEIVNYDGTKRNVIYVTCVSTSIPLYSVTGRAYTI